MMNKTMILIVSLFVLTSCVSEDRIKQFQDMGYDYNDVSVFLRATPYTTYDFINSSSLRLQYELYRNGTTTDFIKQAQETQRAKQASSDSFGGSFIGGFLGSMLGSS